MTLTFVGMGLSGAKGLSLEALEAIKASSKVYIETYTSPTKREVKVEIEDIIARPIAHVTRDFVEDGREILREGSKTEVALITPGDPIVATTHMELLIRARNMGIRTKIIHSSSILSAIPGETGLHPYTFGKTMTMIVGNPTAATTLYYGLLDNLLRGLHTLVLLQQDHPTKFLKPSMALATLMKIEKQEKLNVMGKETSCIVMSRLGQEDQQLLGGKVDELLGEEFGPPPHCIIVPGRLHFTETEAIKTLVEKGENVTENGAKVLRKAEAMINHYVPRAKEALFKFRQRPDKGKGTENLFENVECYLSDSERFLREGKPELAILSLGYAEGLLDALRLLGVMDVEW